MYQHVVQSTEWGQFKSAFGTEVVRVGKVQYTIHKIPIIKLNYAYCPKVLPQDIDWQPLMESLKNKRCIAIKFDVPNVEKGTSSEKRAVEIFTKQSGVIKASKSTFTQNNVVLDLNSDEETLFTNLHSKHRYNIRYAQKQGVTIEHAQTNQDFDTFFQLLELTSKRQKFLIHPKNYYKKMWELFKPLGMVHILIAKHNQTPLAAWMLFVYNDVLYYPYGASDDKYKNLQASNLLGWEAIRLGKSLGCHTFDMWGACKDLNNTKDPEWGFTNFKLKFGGKYVTYMDSYELVLNKPTYEAFNFLYPKVLKLLKLLK